MKTKIDSIFTKSKSCYLLVRISKKIFFFKTLIILFIFYVAFYFIKSVYKASFIKVCLCTLGKNENKYINEFVEHYKKYGVDKIVIYDNNDIGGEKIEEMFIKSSVNGFVEIKNYRGIEKAQFKIMNDCYKKNYNIFNWLIFYDIDEFIYLRYFNSIKVFLNQPKFKECGKVELNWVHRVDNKDSFFYDSRPLSIRFNKKESNILKKNYYPQIKSIIRGHNPNITISCLHKLASGIKGCDGFGRDIHVIDGIKTRTPDYKINYINHYYGKSLEEFVEKIKRGSAAIGRTNISIIAKIDRYFEIYNINEKKIKYIEKETGLNLSKYKTKFK